MSKDEKKIEGHEGGTNITITGGQLLEALKELKPMDPLERTGLSKERIASVFAPHRSRRWRLIASKSPWTDATFDAKLIESAKHPDGRIVELHGYTHPLAIYRTASNGGVCPDGFDIFSQHGLVWTDLAKEPPKQALTPHFRQWRYETYYLRDMKMLIGTGMKALYCVAPNGMATPWREGGAEAA
jgi:hypothetical protein